MTTQYAVLPARSGRSYTAKLLAASDLTTEITVTSITVTELAAKGLYRAVIVKPVVVAAGDYVLIYLHGTVAAAVGYFTFAGTDGETATETPGVAVLDPATQTQINNIESAVSAGSGARTVTITVNDGTTTLQNARVRLTEGANSRTALTNASGVAVLNLDDATYTVAITKSGYAYSGTTMVVNSDETATYSMTATNVTSPTNPDLSAIEVLCLDDDFEAVAGVEVNFRMAAIASGDQNRAHPGAKKTVTSNSSGIARFEGPQGATIEWKRGTGQQWTAVVLDNDSVTNVTSTIGSP